MSKKNLQRTVLEGGSHGYDKWERHYSHKEERAKEKAYISEVMSDLENAYEYDIENIRPVPSDPTYKINPALRWLGQQIGRLWDDVYSDIVAKFNGKQHIIKYVSDQVTRSSREPFRSWNSTPDDPTASYYPNDYYVDDAGLLQKKKYIKRTYAHLPPRYDTNRLANWLNGRIVGQVGKDFYWFVPADKSKKRGGTDKVWRTRWGNEGRYWGRSYYDGPRFEYEHNEPVYKTDFAGKTVYDENRRPITIGFKSSWNGGRPDLRQGKKLDDKDLEFWNKVPAAYQTKVLEHSPTYPNPPKRELGYYW